MASAGSAISDLSGNRVPSITIDTNARTVAARYSDAPKLVAATAVKVMNRIGLKLHAHLLREELRGGSIGVRTGTLSRAAFYRVETMGANEIVVRIGVSLAKAKYARIQNDGGVIKAVGGGYLTIPLQAARTAKGVARFTARELLANPEAFGYSHAFIAKHTIFGRKGSGASVRNTSVVPLFALKKSVTIKAHHFLERTLSKNLQMIRDEFGMGMGDVTRGLE